METLGDFGMESLAFDYSNADADLSFLVEEVLNRSGEYSAAIRKSCPGSAVIAASIHIRKGFSALFSKLKARYLTFLKWLWIAAVLAAAVLYFSRNWNYPGIFRADHLLS